jgi:hypothetical protein
MPSPTPTAAPPAASLPFTFSGQLSTVQGFHPFTAAVSWHFTLTCTNDPSDTGAPVAITVSVRQPSALTAAGFPDAQVGQQLDSYCNGQAMDSDTVNPGGFPAGTYDWLITTGGDWRITVQQK